MTRIHFNRERLPGNLSCVTARDAGQILRSICVALLVILITSPLAAATLEKRLADCLACHGDKGQSTNSEVPSLGAQPQFYLSVQLYMFREHMRSAEPMNAMMKGLSNDELQHMAAALSKLPAPSPAAEPPDPATTERARALIQQHRCNFCHNQDFSGEKNAPRLAGQRKDYLIKTLREYKANTRRAYDTSMADVVYALTDTDILDLAHYLARVK